MITSTEDGTYRVSCEAVTCDRPLMRTVATWSHADNLAKKHLREHHGGVEPVVKAEATELVALLQSRTFVGRELNDRQASEIAALILSAGYAKPPM